MCDNRRCGNCRNCVSSQYEFQNGMKANVAVNCHQCIVTGKVIQLQDDATLCEFYQDKICELKSDDLSNILKTEYSERFDQIRKYMMVMSYYKYGPLKDNYDKYKCMDALGNIEKRIQKYKETGNTEFLADVANFAMIEFMYPSIQGARYTPTDSGACDISGFSINEIRQFDK